jgi:hypothetical protein
MFGLLQKTLMMDAAAVDKAVIQCSRQQLMMDAAAVDKAVIQCSSS